MNKKRTKTIRILLALLVMLTTGGTQRAWAVDGSTIPNGDNAGTISVKTVVNGVETDAGGGATATAYSLPGDCGWMRIIIHVRPNPGYVTGLYYIKYSTDTEGKNYYNFSNVSGNAGDSYGYVDYPVVDLYSTGNDGSYSAKERDIIVYSQYATTSINNIKVEFIYKTLELTHTFGAKATVNFYDGGEVTYDSESNPTNAPTEESFTIPTSSAITSIDNNDGKDRYIIVHIEPNSSCWTDKSLLCAYEAGGALSRTRGPVVDPTRRPTLLKADKYNAGTTDEPDMRTRYDGAGWYYYVLPGTHNFSANYTTSLVDGFVTNKFSLTNGSLTKSGTVFTVTGLNDDLITSSDWTAEFTYDQLSYKFDVAPHKPTLQSVVIKKGGTQLFELTGDAITNQVKVPEEQIAISPQHSLNLESSNNYSWFDGSVSTTDAYFEITVPFKGSGTSSDPWKIESADDLNMLSKCSSVGCYSFESNYLVQTGDIDMGSISDFVPIGLGCLEGGYFRGNFNGKGKKISNLTYNHKEPDIYTDYGYVGLFGFVENGTVENVKLEKCKFSTTFNASAMGGIAGYVKNGTLKDNSVTGVSSISNSIDNDGATGAIVGTFLSGTLSKNYYGYGVTVSNKSGTASGYTKRGLWIGTVSGDGGPTTYSWADFTLNDGAVLWVKKVKLPDANANSSAVTFKQIITPALADATHPADCYNISGKDYYYVVDQPLTLSVNLGNRTDDVRTFYDELKSITLTYVTTTIEGTDVTTTDDITTALSFAMPPADATIAATFTSGDWFTIPSNLRNWMTFYHEWESENDPRDYVVSDGSGTGKIIEVKTIANVDPDKGSFDFADIEDGISFFGVPTIFHYADKNDATTVLPALLKFTPVDPTKSYTKPSVALQFKGTLTGETLDASDKCYVLNNVGDFILAYVSGTDNKILARRCYVDLKDNPTNARVLKMNGGDNATGIHSIDNGQLTMDNADGAWYGIDGRKLQGKPAKKGVYIYKGKKTVVK